MKNLSILLATVILHALGCQPDQVAPDSAKAKSLPAILSPEKAEHYRSYNRPDNPLVPRTPLTYKGALAFNVPVVETGIFGGIEDPALWDYYTFSGEAGQTIAFSVIPTTDPCPENMRLDPIACIFDRIFTDSDELTGEHGYFTPAMIAFADDDVWTCCYGYPCQGNIVLPFTGVYTLTVGNWGACGEVTSAEYQLTLYDVPEPPTCALVTDTDGDGVPDDEDAHPNSNLDPTVNISGCDSGVPNMMPGAGSTMMDLILDCAAEAANHGQFVNCVSGLTNNWKDAGLITGQQKGAIMACAAQ